MEKNKKINLRKFAKRKFEEEEYAIALRAYKLIQKDITSPIYNDNVNFYHPEFFNTNKGFIPDALGHCYEMTGDYENAIKSYRKSAAYLEEHGSNLVAPELFERANNLEGKVENKEVA